MQGQRQSHGKRRRGRKVSEVEGRRVMPCDEVEALPQWYWEATEGLPCKVDL